MDEALPTAISAKFYSYQILPALNAHSLSVMMAIGPQSPV